AYAHRNLIVHRDLKPSNILVCSDGTPKLLDFGIAKLLAPEADFSTVQTATNVGIMTPEYASPEQIRGEPVTTATDVYSLGVVLYELLTDSRPFNFTTRSLEKIIRTVCEVEPIRPSSLVLSPSQEKNSTSPGEQRTKDKGQRTNPKLLKGDLDNIVLMAMRKEPERRYSSIEQFADDVRRHLAGLPVLARQDAFGYRAGKFVSRNKAGVAAGAGILLSLVGGLAATAHQSRKARRQRDKAEKVNRFLQKMLASADPRKQGKDVKVTKILELAAQNIETDFADEPEIVADLRTTIGLTFLNLGQIDKAEPHLRSALNARLKLFGRENHQSAVSLYNFARLLQARGEAVAAENHYRQSLETLRRLPGDNDLEIAAVLHHLGYTLTVLGENEEAIGVLREELKIRRARLGENHPDVANALSELGSVLTVAGDVEAAEPLQRQALAIARRFHGDEHPDTAVILINLFGAIQHKNPAEAEILVTEALRIRRKLLGDNHPEVAWSLYHLSFLKITQGAAAEAEALAREILNLRGATLTDEHLLVSNALSILGRSLTAQNRLPEAETILRECLALRRKNLSPEHWLLATTRSFLGECLARRGDFEAGKALLVESYETLLQILGARHAQTAAAKERLDNVSEIL
ncbi:MAG: serine/threonine-protein kinase, partial [Acidobacteriota bacterium]|nr:serine/threonine-protein kinase [Acidobacteriota bacterium]